MMFVKAIITQKLKELRAQYIECSLPASAVYVKHSPKDRKPSSGVSLWKGEEIKKEGRREKEEKETCFSLQNMISINTTSSILASDHCT